MERERDHADTPDPDGDKNSERRLSNDAMSNLADWRTRIRHWIGQQIPSGVRHDEELEQRLSAVMNFELPTDAELRAMQQRGELPPDGELPRGWV
jgi:hypothetical protein